MGACKESMKPKSKSEDSKFGLFTKKKESKPKEEMSFADAIELCDSILTKLINVKEGELSSEPDKVKNSISLARLRTMSYHLEEIIELAIGY